MGGTARPTLRQVVTEPSRTLPDHPCRPGGILLVGVNPSPVSVAVGHYYQGRLGKRLWERLRRLGLLNDESAIWEDDAFVAAGHGLTDLVKRPTSASSELSAAELAAGRTALADKVRAWRPGMLLFAFRAPAEALLGRGVVPGRGPDLEGIPTFLLSGPYAPAEHAANIDAELRELLAAKPIRGARPDNTPVPSFARPAPTRPTTTASGTAGGPTQRITAADLAAGRIRMPARSRSGAKSVFPAQAGPVPIVLRGEPMVVRYDPRLGPDRERSGVLSVRSARLRRLVKTDEVLQVTVDAEGVAHLA